MNTQYAVVEVSNFNGKTIYYTRHVCEIKSAADSYADYLSKTADLCVEVIPVTVDKSYNDIIIDPPFAHH